VGEETRNQITIRQGTAEDAQAIYDIGCQCFSDPWRLETVRHDLEQPLSRYWVAEMDGIVCAYACYWFVADEAQLVNIGVEPSHRRLGMASRLLEAGLNQAEEEGMNTFYLEVRVSNLGAQALYRKFGLSVLTLRKGVYDYPREDGYIMSRSLKSSE
jgi:ribosomal-protein-alanine N-acetyltransferase